MYNKSPVSQVTQVLLRWPGRLKLKRQSRTWSGAGPQTPTAACTVSCGGQSCTSISFVPRLPVALRVTPGFLQSHPPPPSFGATLPHCALYLALGPALSAPASWRRCRFTEPCLFQQGRLMARKSLRPPCWPPGPGRPRGASVPPGGCCHRLPCGAGHHPA